MTYQYSWEKTNTLSPSDFIQEQNDEFEMFNEFENDLEDIFVDVEEFDTDEILW